MKNSYKIFNRLRLPDLLYSWFIISLIIPNIALSITEPMSFWAKAANILLPLGVLGWLGASSRKIGRTVWLMLPIAVLAAFQIVLLGLYGRSVIAVDMFLNVATTNSHEAGELLSQLLPSVITVCVLYLPSIVTATIIIARGSKMGENFSRISREVSTGIGLAGAIALAICYMSPKAYSARTDLFPVNACYNAYLALDRTLKTKDYENTSSDYSFDAKPTHPAEEREICVLVIGETSRVADWEIFGYGRNTNPLLKQREGLYGAGKAYSESNTTHKSVPMLLSTVNSAEFNTDIYRVKSIITAFKEAGFHTAFLSNQGRNHSFIDFFGEEADKTIFIQELPKKSKEKGDFALLTEMDNVLKENNKKQLIVLHTYGSHFNYDDRFGKEDEMFIPCDYSEASKDQREELVNAYDNTIVSTDRFLDSVIERINQENSMSWMIYASDHGEDIFDNGSNHFLHASPMPSENQVRVPFLVWLSDNYRGAHPEIANQLASNMKETISSTRSFTPTALSLAGIDTPKLDRSSSLADPQFTPKPLKYLNDHNESVALQSML